MLGAIRTKTLKGFEPPAKFNLRNLEEVCRHKKTEDKSIKTALCQSNGFTMALQQPDQSFLKRCLLLGPFQFQDAKVASGEMR
jgi:hypothetical protein